ncbi:MAG: transposase [Eubacterium ramulus]
MNLECIQRNLNKNNALALDLGINNLVTAVSNSGKTFIIDGKNSLNPSTSGSIKKMYVCNP